MTIHESTEIFKMQNRILESGKCH